MMLDPVTLEGRFVRLEPLTDSHVQALTDIGLDPDLWRWTTVQIKTREDLASYVAEALRAQEAGTSLPFVTIERSSNQVAGITRFANAERAHRRVEIGWTFVGKRWQRTAINTEAKYLMLRHAFEVWQCLRVELKTDALNLTSRAAILRIGAKEEGTLRSHMVVANGRVRDTVYFSVIQTEWPAVAAELEKKLNR